MSYCCQKRCHFTTKRSFWKPFMNWKKEKWHLFLAKSNPVPKCLALSRPVQYQDRDHFAHKLLQETKWKNILNGVPKKKEEFVSPDMVRPKVIMLIKLFFFLNEDHFFPGGNPVTSKIQSSGIPSKQRRNNLSNFVHAHARRKWFNILNC